MPTTARAAAKRKSVCGPAQIVGDALARLVVTVATAVVPVIMLLSPLFGSTTTTLPSVVLCSPGQALLRRPRSRSRKRLAHVVHNRNHNHAPWLPLLMAAVLFAAELPDAAATTLSTYGRTITVQAGLNGTEYAADADADVNFEPASRSRRDDGTVDIYEQNGYLLETKDAGAAAATAIVALGRNSPTLVCAHGKTITLWQISDNTLLHTFK